MTHLTPNWATDLAILAAGGSKVADHGDHLVVRTAANPQFHWGNFVLVTDPGTVDDPDRWRGVFAENFPDADWWPSGCPSVRRRLLPERAGLPLQDPTLVTGSRPAATSRPAGQCGASVRPGD